MSDSLKFDDLTDDMTIQAIRSYTYSLKDIYTDLVDAGAENITMDDLIEMAESYAKDDLSCGYGHSFEKDEIEFIYNLENGVSYE